MPTTPSQMRLPLGFSLPLGENSDLRIGVGTMGDPTSTGQVPWDVGARLRIQF